MKMKTIIKMLKKEHGQIIPILVISLIALIAMAALLLDGGALLLNRRSAQNAADAAALAGARIYCGAVSATSAQVEATIIKYTEDNNATLLNWYITAENVGDGPDKIEQLAKGEVVVSVAVEHDSFFARIFNQDTLRATATAGAGCFPYGPDTILPVAFPCMAPVRTAEDGVSIKSDACDYLMLEWDYFDKIATELSGCMSTNPLLEGVTPTKEQGKCISEYLVEHHPELIYIVATGDKFCAKDPENVDYDKELVCNFFGDNATNLTNSSRGWLNLGGANLGTNTLRNWISGDEDPGVLHEHIWLAFIGGGRENPGYEELAKRLYEIVYIPTFNYVCPQRPVKNDWSEGSCWEEAHNGWDDEDGKKHYGVPDTEGICSIKGTWPNRDYAHVVAFAPFFTTCVREKSNDLKNHNPKGNPSIYDYDPEGFVSDCPGFELAATIEVKDEEGKSFYPNMRNLEDADYSLEGFFISPKYLDNPENISQGGADLGVYIAALTR